MKNRIGGYTLVSLSLIDLALASAGVVYVDGLGERLHAIGDKPVILTDIVVSNEKKKPTPVQIDLELDYEEAEDEESEPTPIYKATIKGVYGYTIHVENDAVETEAEKDALTLEDEISDLQEGKANIVHIDWDISLYTTMTQEMYDEIKDADIIVDVDSYSWIVVLKYENCRIVVRLDEDGGVICRSITDSEILNNFTSNFQSLNGKQDKFISEFSTSSTYSVGDYVVYSGKLYKCTTAISTAGSWDSTKWAEVTIADLDNANVQAGTKLYRHTITYSNYPTITIYYVDGTSADISPTYANKQCIFTSNISTPMTTTTGPDIMPIIEGHYNVSTGKIYNLPTNFVPLATAEAYTEPNYDFDTDAYKASYVKIEFPSGTTFTDTVTPL